MLDDFAGEARPTTWGRPPPLNDVRALRRYHALLRALARAGGVMAAALAILVSIGAIAALTLTNFENAIISDGTSRACVYDGNTNQIIHDRQTP